MAIKADSSFNMKNKLAGVDGMKTARAIGLLSYRNSITYNLTQKDDKHLLKNYRASSYQNYQGEKLARRFNAFSYYFISKAFDTHNVGRGRGGLVKALEKVKSNTLVIGISSDLLFPVSEQKFVAKNIKNAKYFEIKSEYGHDGFLLEYEQLQKIIQKQINFLSYENTC